MAFGIDRPFGWFFQYWKEEDSDLGVPSVDKSMRLSQGDLTTLLRKYAKPSSDLRKAIDAIVLDLEPSQMGIRDLNRRASEPTLKGRLAKLAFDNPDMREALLPLLRSGGLGDLTHEEAVVLESLTWHRTGGCLLYTSPSPRD